MVLSEQEKTCIEWLRRHDLIGMFHKAIQHPNAVGQFLSGHAGWQWEDELKDILDEKDIFWEPTPKLNERHELIVGGVTVQCKFTGNPTTANIMHNGHTMLYNIGDYDVLALKVKSEDCSRYFIIPAEELHNPKKPGKLLGSVSVEKIKRWENAWWVLSQTPHPAF